MFSAETIAIQPQIDSALAEVLKNLSPWIRHIRYEVKPDWAGDMAVYFRVVLTDEATSKAHLQDVTTRFENGVSDRIIPETGLFTHFNYRSESENAKIKDSAWAANY